MGLLLLMVATGAAVAFQAPVNAALARRTGDLPAALVSFTVGTLLLALAVATTRSADWSGLRGAPPWLFLGGALGAIYVTAFITTVPRLGATAAMVAALAGQLAAAVWIDRAGWFGLAERPLDARRLAGLLLLTLSVWLIRPGR